MSTGLYSITTRASGTILTAAIYNSDQQNHVTNQAPLMTGAYSDNVAQMKIQTNPGGEGSESLSGSLAGEIERLRFQLAAVIGRTFWYDAPATTLQAAAGSIAPTNHYDFAFQAGLQSDGTWAPLAVQTYGAVSLGRNITLTGDQGVVIAQGPAGQNIVMDILVNGTSIYAARPQIRAGDNAYLPGTINSNATVLLASWWITFNVIQVGGGGQPGAGLMFTLKGHE